ncbi:MAG TPA: undecaprenyldiphospho-muramoylpentapeptide beta-N-acetylglucosaminyltransferase [Polyangiales bacterium]|nr:undecaprenyldiphospho-muramoylpentapeptide beta-N-acetylglucosaminyltransferase [Polyangiales bacterium]
MSILLAGGGTGGHVYPLLALADALLALRPGLRVVFVGTDRGLEKQVVPARGYELELVRVVPIRGSGVRGALLGAVRAFGSIPESRALLRRHAPRAVCSIGGYAAGPIAVVARALGIPLAVIEPNSVIGLTNRWTARFARRAYTAFPETDVHFAAAALRRTGVPLRPGFTPQPYARAGGPLSILVLGGSQGARALNETVPEALARLSFPVRVLHQTGKAHAAGVRERYAALGLSPALVVPFIDDVPASLAAAELVIGRAGASTLSEICAVGRPSLLVPYPFAADNHQLENAESLVRAGAARCVPQAEATPERIASEVTSLVQDDRLPLMAERARAWGRPDAARDVARDLLSWVGLYENRSVA